MKKQYSQLKTVITGIIDKDEDVNALVLVEKQGEQFIFVYGEHINIAVNIAYAMHKIPGLDEVFKDAIKAYDNVPVK